MSTYDSMGTNERHYYDKMFAKLHTMYPNMHDDELAVYCEKYVDFLNKGGRLPRFMEPIHDTLMEEDLFKGVDDVE